MVWQPPGLLSGRQRSGRLGVCCSACTAVAKRAAATQSHSLNSASPCGDCLGCHCHHLDTLPPPWAQALPRVCVPRHGRPVGECLGAGE